MHTQIGMIILYLLLPHANKGTLYPTTGFLDIYYGDKQSEFVPFIIEGRDVGFIHNRCIEQDFAKLCKIPGSHDDAPVIFLKHNVIDELIIFKD
ncbi:hypothetical protein RYX36_008036 [Vicia faba]